MIRSLVLAALIGGAFSTHAQENASSVQVLWAGDDALVFVDAPSDTTDQQTYKKFFYHELQQSNPNILLVMVNEADCSQTGRLRTHQVALLDMNRATVTNPEQTDVLERNEWKNYNSASSIHGKVWTYICQPNTRDPKAFVAQASVSELIETYQAVAAEQKRKQSGDAPSGDAPND